MLNFPVSIYIHGAGTSEGALGQGKPTDTYQSMSGSGQGTVSKVNNPKRYQLGMFLPHREHLATRGNSDGCHSWRIRG